MAGIVRIRTCDGHRRHLILLLFVMALALVPSGEARAAPTTVSLTFDDGSADQAQAASILASHSMRGTLYVTSGKIGSSSYYMNWEQVHQFASSGLGNEIGGHTVDHVDLTTLGTSQQVAQVCNDRQALVAQGFSPTSFAYPYARANASAKQVVRDCGYSSGRGVGNAGCGGCAAAETIPPADAFLLRTTRGATPSDTVSTFQNYVTNAEANGGGWLIFVFHNICNGCNENAFSATNLTQLLDWLQPRAANGTVVKTVGEVMNPGPPGVDTTPPTTSITCNGGVCSGSWYRTGVSVGLAATDSGGSGVAGTCFTTDGSEPTASGGACTHGSAYAGPFNVTSSTTVRFLSYDRSGNTEAAASRLIRIDAASPTGVAITTPASGATIPVGSTPVSATASDSQSGVASVRFYVDGRLIGTDTAAPYSVTWSTKKGKDRGAHTLYAEASDVAGNVTRSPSIAVTVN